MKNNMESRKILLGLTSTKGSAWRKKIEEIQRYGIEEISAFPTFLEKKERLEMYALLEKTSLKRIPHVHLRNDMTVSELDYFVQRWNTEVFNIHNGGKYPLKNDLSKYAPLIFIENDEISFDGKKYLSDAYLPSKKELQQYGGLCLDLAHREDFILKQKIAAEKAPDEMRKMLENFKIGCCHISVIKKTIHRDKAAEGLWEFSWHNMKNLNELDYVRKYFDILPNIISIELENSFQEQLEVKKYLEKIINNG